MVYEIVHAGRKMRALKKGLRSKAEYKKYVENREKLSKKHALAQDIEILNEDVNWLRFSPHAFQYIQDLKMPSPLKDEEEFEIPKKASNLPEVSIQEVLLEPGDWAGKNVIIEGELELHERKKNGESRHMFSDRTGLVTAISKKDLSEGEGTLFGVAHKTRAGNQVYLEIKNFHKKE